MQWSDWSSDVCSSDLDVNELAPSQLGASHLRSADVSVFQALWPVDTGRTIDQTAEFDGRATFVQVRIEPSQSMDKNIRSFNFAPFDWGSPDMFFESVNENS
jgi:hypothetical protein